MKSGHKWMKRRPRQYSSSRRFALGGGSALADARVGLNLAQVVRRRKCATVVQNRGLDGGNPIGESSRPDIDEIEAQVTIRLFVDLFKTQGVLEADPARLGRSDEAKVLHKQDALFEDRGGG